MTALRKFAAPARQPIDVEELLGWTYRIQQADMAGRERDERSPTARAARALALGLAGAATLPCAPHLFLVHADAARVHETVCRVLQPPYQLLVIEQARKGERPDWCQGVTPKPVMRPALDGRGRVRWNHAERRPHEAIVWTDADGQPLAKSGGVHNYGYCLVDYVPAEAFIEAARGIYRAWRASLYELHVALADAGLSRWRALPPRAPAAPWEHGT